MKKSNSPVSMFLDFPTRAHDFMTPHHARVVARRLQQKGINATVRNLGHGTATVSFQAPDNHQHYTLWLAVHGFNLTGYPKLSDR